MTYRGLPADYDAWKTRSDRDDGPDDEFEPEPEFLEEPEMDEPADIAALVKRLRIYVSEAATIGISMDPCAEAADALEALQTELDAAGEIIRMENERSSIVSARTADARDVALEEAAQAAETYKAAAGQINVETCIAAAIRALAGDKP